MLRKLVAATVSTILAVSSIAPGIAAAQEYRFTGTDAPRGLTATVNLRVPLGRQAAADRPTYGLTLGYGRAAGADVDGRTRSRAMNFADLRFSGPRMALDRASLASFDLAHLDRDRRMNLVGKKSTLVLGIVIGAAIVICLAADCFGDDDDTEPAN
jgi:hypothetical protein